MSITIDGCEYILTGDVGATEILQESGCDDIVEIIIPGPQGPPGIGGGNAYIHTQSVPATLWTINHNRGVYPAIITLIDTGGAEFEAEVLNTSVNQVQVYLTIPVAGQARLI